MAAHGSRLPISKSWSNIPADNTVATPVPKGLRAEWGFAAAVDGVLFDTGQSESVVHNARLLDVPTRFDTIVLSHTHSSEPTARDSRHKRSLQSGFPRRFAPLVSAARSNCLPNKSNAALG